MAVKEGDKSVTFKLKLKPGAAMNCGQNSLTQLARPWAPSMRMSPRLGSAYGHHCGGFR